MKLSHVVYKVNDLEAGISYFRNKGFEVQYGAKERAHNALIYFSEGPYIEILEKVHLPLYVKIILKILGKQKIVERLDGWAKSQEGFVDLCLENYDEGFNQEQRLLKNAHQKYFRTKSKRVDPSDRVLKWKLLFPFELRLPFLMTYFTIDPKPKDFIHPNGLHKIKSITFGTRADLVPLVTSLCDDERLTVTTGNGVTHVDYE